MMKGSGRHGADAARPYGLDTQHDPRRASALARRTGGDDNGLLGALQPFDLLLGSAMRCSRLVTPSRCTPRWGH
jgi:hypothetical protein